MKTPFQRLLDSMEPMEHPEKAFKLFNHEWPMIQEIDGWVVIGMGEDFTALKKGDIIIEMSLN